MSAKIFDITPTLNFISSVPSWWNTYWRKSTYYHDSCLDLFELRKDRRFASGYAWFCRKCNKYAYTREDYYENIDVFVTTVVMCHLGCRRIWKLEGTDSILKDIGESLDLTMFDEEMDSENNKILLFKKGIVKNRVYFLNKNQKQYYYENNTNGISLIYEGV